LINVEAAFSVPLNHTACCISDTGVCATNLVEHASHLSPDTILFCLLFLFVGSGTTLTSNFLLTGHTTSLTHIDRQERTRLGKFPKELTGLTEGSGESF
jgi:hypothetical protein